MSRTLRRLAAPLAMAVMVVGCSPDESAKPARPPAISLSKSALTFAATMAGAAAPAAQTVTIDNSGDGTLAVPSVTVAYGGGPTGWIAVEVSGTAAPFTLTVTPSSAVAAGAHTATIQVASAGASNTPASVSVAFTVTANTEPVIAVTASALRFTAQIGEADPAAQAITVSNGGGGTLADPTVGVDYGTGPVGWLTAGAVGMDVTVTAALGALPRGRYEATVSIDSAGAFNTPVLVPVVFDVTEPALAVSPASLAFSMVGDSIPGPKTLLVSNAADGALAVPTVSSDRAWLAANVSGTSAPFTVTAFIPAGTYPVGSYSGSLTIDSSNASNGPVIVPVTFTVSLGPPVKVSCYSAADSVCTEFTSTSSSARASFQAQCTSGGDAAVACPSANKIGPCAVMADYDFWFYAPAYTVDSAIFICSQVSGTWEGPPASGGSTHQVNFACNFPADANCTDVSGLMTQSQEDGFRGMCTNAGGSIITACATFSRIGTCTFTQSGVTFRDRFYTGSGATAADCTGPGEVWTPN